MRKILVLGAGHSTPFLVRYLLDRAQELEADVTVADLDGEAAARLVGRHPRGRAVAFDVTDPAARRREMADADVAVHLLPPAFQGEVAEACLEHGVDMVSASYRSRRLVELAPEAERRGRRLVCELGLDPGIDLMSTCDVLERVRAAGGHVRRFWSYGGGLPEAGFDGNPLRYCITWNPRNVVMAAEHGAQFLEDGALRFVPWHRVMESTWTVDVPGVGRLDAYPNRDSVVYRGLLDLDRVETLVRATLRFPPFCAVWRQLVRLGLPNEHLTIERPESRTYGELVEMFLPRDAAGRPLDVRLADFLGLDAEGEVMAALRWLGLVSDEPLPVSAVTPARALVHLLERRLPLPAGSRDMVVLHHVFEVRYPAEAGSPHGRDERVVSTFVEHGERGGTTAMAKTVGLPAALGVVELLAGRIAPTGVLIPTRRELFRPILRGLEAEGFTFREETTPLDATPERVAERVGAGA